MSKRRQFLRNIAIASISLNSAGSIARSVGRKITSPDLLECEETTLDLYGEGPFYTDNPPAMDNNILVGEAEPGERMIISGRVFNLDCTEYIPDTLIDVWHADDAGAYPPRHRAQGSLGGGDHFRSGCVAGVRRAGPQQE